MTCRYCGTELPEGALFCGECGQPVLAPVAPASTASIVSTVRSVRAVPAAGAATADAVNPAAGFSIADLAFSSPGETSQPEDAALELPDGSPLDPTPSELVESAARCPQCGEPMAEGDVFCGECGFVVRNVDAPAAEVRHENQSQDAATSAIAVVTGLGDLGGFPLDPEAPESPPADESALDPEPVDSELVDSELVDSEPVDSEPVDAEPVDADATTEIEPLLADELQPEPEPEPEPEPPAEPEPAPEPEPEPSIDDMVREAAPAAAAPADPDLEFDEPLPLGAPVAKPSPSPRSRPIPDPFPWGTDRPLREDIEATRLVADAEFGTRYVLQFSTGESVTVGGSGLVGRNPSVQPGEYVDQLVPIFDASKSVSKTHLEFGQESGRFWVSDRYSTNGSVIRQPDAEPRRCDPGRRYFIARGSRVDVGEQFFVVS